MRKYISKKCIYIYIYIYIIDEAKLFQVSDFITF